MARVTPWVRKYWLVGLVILLPVLIVLPPLQAFPFPSNPGSYSDLAVTHYPNAYFLRRELFARLTMPLWSPTILSGYPFYANPLSGLFYPPGWLALLLPLPAGFNLLAAIHLVLGAFGLALLMRLEGLDYSSALFGGLAFGLMPKIVAHYGAGHLTLIYAISWTPWLLWATRLKRASSQERGVLRNWLQPGLVLALVMLADIRWAVYAILLWYSYEITHSHNILLSLKLLVQQTVLTLLLAAPLLFPLVEYANLSTRSMMTAEDVLAFSLPPAYLLGLVVPGMGHFHEWVLYPGGIVLCLGVIGLISWHKFPSCRYWAVLAIICMFVALGSSLPGSRLIAQLPGFNLLRVPSRALFLAGVGMVALAAGGLQAIFEKFRSDEIRWINLILVALAGFTLLLSVSASLAVGNLAGAFIWGAVAVVIAAFWIGLGVNGRLSERGEIWLIGLVCLACIDLVGVDRSLITFRTADEVFQEGLAAAEWLSQQESLFRVYSPSYSLPQQTAARFGLQLADGVDPLQLGRYADFMERASGVPRQRYSVTLPAFLKGDPATANAGNIPDGASLGLINVRFIVSAFDLSSKDLALQEQFGDTRIYENLKALPRAWVQAQEGASGENAALVQIIKWSPNQISLTARGPGLLVLSEIDYPGWYARVDGQPAQIERYAGLLRAIQLQPGNHEIVFSLHPTSLYLGCLLALVGIGFLGWNVRSQLTH